METKFCKICGKELPMESTFCPYCMTKLIDVETGKPIKTKKKISVLPVIIISAVLVIAIFVGTLAVFLNSSQNNVMDYSSYLGVWSDKDSIEDINSSTNGYNTLEIISVKENIISFIYTKTSAYEKVSTISNVTCEIIDNVGRFTFDDDGWGNKGTGKIKFVENEIYLETTITDENSEALWDIGGSCYLSKLDKSTMDFKSYDVLNQGFKETKNSFGEESADSQELNISKVYHYSNFDVTVSLETNKITSVNVYYTHSLSKSLLSYGDINGYSTYEDIYASLGEPSKNELTDGYVEYTLEGNKYLSFFFGDDMNLTSFNYSIYE